MRDGKNILRGHVLACQRITLSMVLLFSLALTACGSPDEPVESVELLESVRVVMGTETVRLRNLYDAYVYEAGVYPYMEEYGFEESLVFDSYGAMVGESVQKGTPLVYAATDALRAQEESLEETLRTLAEEYEAFCREKAEEIATWNRELEYAEEVLENLAEQRPEEYLPAQDGKDQSQSVNPGTDSAAGQGGSVPQTVNPAYTRWLADKKKWEGEFSIKDYYIGLAEKELSRRKELYELDCGYYGGRLQQLQDEERKRILTSQMSGTVLSMGKYLPGDSLRAGRAVVTVGDFGRMKVKCSAIPNVAVALRRAQDVYAFFGGVRHEIVYEENDAAGYASFALQDGTGVSAGDCGVVVLVMDSRKMVPTLSVEAVYTDGARKYVYVREGGQTVTREVETGFSDGIYTEILSGIGEGEPVLLAQAGAAGGSDTAVLARGTCGTPYQGNGTVYYPKKTLVVNPVEHGTVYFQEPGVAVSQYVREGDVVAVIRVEGDKVELRRLELDLARARERLADLQAEGQEEAAAEREEYIAQLAEKIAIWQADYAETAIRTPVSGIVDYRMGADKDTVVRAGEAVARIADVRSGYLVLNTNLLNYGDELEITYTDREGETRTATGTVVTMGTLPRDGRYQAQDMLVAFPGGEIDQVAAAREVYAGRYSENRLSARGLVRKIENVVLVPQEAVTVKNGRTYVNVVREDGEVTAVSFLAGGRADGRYWVIDGLTEGMTICWE